VNINKYINILKNNSLFADFTKDELLSLFNKNNLQVLDYEKGQLIYIEKQKSTTLDIILSGSLLIQKIHENGNILTISEFHQGENIGGNLIFADHHLHPMTVIAKSKCKILHLERELVLELCQFNKVFLCEILKSLSNKTTIISGKLSSIAMGTLRQRIMEFLAREYFQKGNVEINLNMSRKEWAEKLGVQRPSLSRELMKMKKEGLIDYSRNYILIKDIDLLKEFSMTFPIL